MADFVIGVDAHKRNHTFVAVDHVGRKLATKTVDATAAGHQAAIRWGRATCSPGSRLWGVKDLRGLTRWLETELLNADEAVVRVPSNLTARQRASARSAGKSDAIDALAVARAALREPDLPIARHDDYSRNTKLLVDRRDDLVTMRVGLFNRVLARLHEIDPELPPAQLVLRYTKHRQSALARLKAEEGVLAEVARDELLQASALSDAIRIIDKRIKKIVKTGAPALYSIDGCGPLMAAKIIGETADITRFATEAKYARYVGMAPLPHHSGGKSVHVRATKAGNRQLNRALHTIAMVHIRRGGHGEQYYRKRRDEGDNHRQAIRCLKRYVCRAVYHALAADTKARAG